MNSRLVQIGAVATLFLAATVPGQIFANEGSHKVNICHATGSETNPYVFITVSEHAAQAHRNHQDRRDIFEVNGLPVMSANDCPQFPPPPPCTACQGPQAIHNEDLDH